MWSKYFEALTNAKSLGENLFTGNEKIPVSNIGIVAVRSGGMKGELISSLVRSVAPDAEIYLHKSTFQEDMPENKNLTPRRKAAGKVIDWGGTESDVRSVFKSDPAKPGFTVSVASDVVQEANGKILHKPSRDSNLDEIKDLLSNLLIFEGEKQFTAHANIAALAKDPNYIEDMGRGLIADLRTSFKSTSFTREEIDFYIYGLSGKDGTFPQAALDILSELKQQFEISPDEETLLGKGLSSDELKLTTAALRWLHPLFQRHMVEIDGIGLNDDRFNQQLNRLFSSLMGAPQELNLLLQNISQDTLWTNQRSIFPEMPGNWKEFSLDKESESVLIEKADVSDFETIEEMSLVAFSNFITADSYDLLSAHQKQLYIQANSVEGTRDLISHPDNIVVLVSRDLKGKITGYVVLRKNGEENMAQIKRAHVEMRNHKKGIGQKLLTCAEDLARDAGIKFIKTQATGSSESWFSKFGYVTIGRSNHADGVFNGGESTPKFALMQKEL